MFMIAERSDCPWWLIFLLVSVPALVMYFAARGLAGWLDGREERLIQDRLRAVRVRQTFTTFKS